MVRLTKTRIYDALHKTVVTGLIGFTALGTVWLVFKGAKYVFFTKPERRQIARQQAEEKLSQEQMEREAELLRQQQEAETHRL